MSGRRRSERDRRRRTLGQNFLADRRLVDQLVDDLGIEPDDLVVEPGAGRGVITVALAARAAHVIAIERDAHWARQLRGTLADAELDTSVRVVRGDLRTVRLPTEPYRVVGNPPFGLTTELLARLLDDPVRGPERVDVIVQTEVARKHAATPPVALRTAAWSPWWTFEVGRAIPRRAFRPVPSVDAAVLTIRRRDDPVLPERLAPGFRDLLRPAWDRPDRQRRRSRA